jgi:hypothetical protein
MRRTLLALLLTGLILSACASSGEESAVVDDTDVSSAPGLQLDPEEIPNAPAMEALAAEILGSPTSEADAIALIESEGFTARVTQRDGESLPATMDYRTDRFNLTVTNDTVTDLSVG